MRAVSRFLPLLAIPALLLVAALPAHATHARPKGADPFRASLVPAFAPCTAPDRTHGPPLSFGSCSSPTQASQYVTVGTPDANGAAAQSTAWFKWRVSLGVPGPPHDTQTFITADITDVRCTPAASTCGSANVVGGPDYTGQLQVVVILRITDHFNNVDPGGGQNPATMEDYTARFAFSCAATADTAIGSRCVMTSNPSAHIPGFTPEGQRTIWEFGQAQIYDGGADGTASTTGDNTLFLVQGLFIP